jgi:hypothetical protein
MKAGALAGLARWGRRMDSPPATPTVINTPRPAPP